MQNELSVKCILQGLLKEKFNSQLQKLLGCAEDKELVLFAEDPRTHRGCCIMQLADPRFATLALLLDGAKLTAGRSNWRFEVAHNGCDDCM